MRSVVVDSKLQKIFQEFGELADFRMTNGVATTEDSIRYTLFASMLDEGILPHEIVLEYPHPAIDRARIDTWLPNHFRNSVAIEFKYDRDPPGGMNQPKTQKAGAVFKDLRRLLLAGNRVGCDCYFVYLTTREMSVYFANIRNGHHQFFDLDPGESIEIDEAYFAGKPTTFTRALGGDFAGRITGVLSRPVGDDCSLRI